MRILDYERSEKKRRPGALKDRIHFAADFDVLPKDIDAAFGAAEAR